MRRIEITLWRNGKPETTATTTIDEGEDQFIITVAKGQTNRAVKSVDFIDAGAYRSIDFYWEPLLDFTP